MRRHISEYVMPLFFDSFLTRSCRSGSSRKDIIFVFMLQMYNKCYTVSIILVLIPVSSLIYNWIKLNQECRINSLTLCIWSWCTFVWQS
jgi:hypothetical protein